MVLFVVLAWTVKNVSCLQESLTVNHYKVYAVSVGSQTDASRKADSWLWYDEGQVCLQQNIIYPLLEILN